MELQLNDNQENLNDALDEIYDILKERNLTGVVIISDGTVNSCKLVKLDATYSLIEYDGVSEEGNPLYLFDTKRDTVGEFKEDAEATLNVFESIAYNLYSTSVMLQDMHAHFKNFIGTVIERVKFKSELTNFTKNSN